MWLHCPLTIKDVKFGESVVEYLSAIVGEELANKYGLSQTDQNRVKDFTGRNMTDLVNKIGLFPGNLSDLEKFIKAYINAVECQMQKEWKEREERERRDNIA